MTAPRTLRGADAATWGPRPDTERQRPQMRLVSWTAVHENSLRGFATVMLPIGIKIHDVPVLVSHGHDGPVLVSHGKAWATFPSTPQLDAEGRHKLDINGKRTYEPVFEWRDRRLSDQLSAAVVEFA